MSGMPGMKRFPIERKRSYRGLEKFIQRYPGSIPVHLDKKLGKKLLEAESADDIVRSLC